MKDKIIEFYHDYAILMLHSEFGKKYYMIASPEGGYWTILFDMRIRAKKAIIEHIKYGIVP